MSQAQQGKATSVFTNDNNLLFTCNGCGYSSQHRYLYERHVKRCVAIATGETYDSSAPRGRTPQLVHRNYRCKQCNFTTTKSKLFLAHRRAVHGDNIKIYPCDICEYASKYKSKLLRHRNLKHKGAGDYSEENAGYMSEETAEDLLLNASNHLHIAIGSNGNNHNSSNTLTIAFNSTIGDRVLSSNNDTSSEVGKIQVQEEPKVFHENSSQDEESQEENIQQQREYKSTLDGNTSQEESLIEDEGRADNAFNFISEATSSSGRPLSQCTLCNYSNPHKWKVANHVRSFHMKKKLFKCSECDFVTGRKIEFCVHKAKTHATSKVYSCIECSYCTISRTNYERHINNHVGGGPIKCTYCSYSSTGEAAVIRHMQEYHPKQQMTPSALKKPQPRPAPTPPQSVFTADRSKTYSSPASGVANYTDIAYRPNKPADGGMEMKAQKFTPMNRIGGDILSFAKKAAGRTGNEVDCPVCGITFRTEARLRIHMVSHSDEASHHCPLCSLKYKRTSDLNRHMKKKHDAKLRDFFYMGVQEQPLNLSVRSEFIPNNRYSLVQPSTSEEDQPLDLSTKPKPQAIQVPNVTNKPYRGPYNPEELKCTLCSYLAKWPSDLKRHALVHSMEKRYKCEHCQRRYKYQFDLNMHMRRSHHMATSRPRVSNVIQNEASPPLSGGMSLPTQVHLSSSPVSTLNASPDSGSPLRMRSSSLPPQNSSPPDHQEGSSSPLASLRPLLPTPSPPLPPIQVNVPMEVVFAPSSIHDMENTLPPSMQRIVDPVGTSADVMVQEKPKPPVEQHLPPSKQGKSNKPSEEKPLQSAKKDKNLKSISSSLTLKKGLPPPPPAEQAISGVEYKPPRILKMKAMKPQRLSSLTAARKFKCKYCPYLGLYQSEVDRHTRLHTGEKPYKCVYCVYRSAWKGDMKRHIIKHHAPEISMASSLESIIEYCCSPRRDDDDNSNAGDGHKMEAVNYEFSDELTGVESTNEELPDFGYSDEDEEIEAKIERVRNKIHESEDEDSREAQMKEVDLSTTGTRSETGDSKKHLDHNGNKHIEVSSRSQRNVHNTAVNDLTMEDKEIESESGGDETGSERKVQHCPHCPFICEAPSKMKCHIEIHEDLKRFKCQHCGKRSNWFWDIRKHIKKDHPGRTMMVATLSEKEARETLETYLNSPLFRTLSKNSPGRKSPANSEVAKEEVKSETEQSEDENMNTDCTDMKKDAVNKEDEKISDTINEVINKCKEYVEETEKASDIAEEENNNTMKIPTGSSRGKKYRPYKCSACPRRSNWRWDIMKHIRKIHPSAKMITLSEDVAKATFSESVMKRPKGQGLKAQKKVEKVNKEKDVNEKEHKTTTTKDITPKNRSTSEENNAVMVKSVKDIKIKNKESTDVTGVNIPFKKRKLEVKEDKQLMVLKQSPRKKPTIPKAFIPETIPKSPKKAKVETIKCKGSKDNAKAKQNIPGVEHADETAIRNGPNGKPILRCLKRYKCYYCPYRSNYRSDIGRHGKRLHRKQQLKVVILDEEEAASTLQDYRQKYAKKKFVLAANEISERVRRKSKQNEKSSQSKNEDRPTQVEWTSESAGLAKSSKTSRSLLEKAVDFSKLHAKNITNQQSSRVLLDQSNVLTRCYEHGAMGCSCQSELNCSIRQLINGATTTIYMNRENALPK